MNPAEYAGVATAAPGFLFEPSEAWLAVAWPLALAFMVALADGWWER